jgi:hypothetical protein
VIEMTGPFGWYADPVILAFVLAVPLSGCTTDQGPITSNSDPDQQSTAASADERLPEAVFREFFIKSLRPDERTIRSLILDHPDSDILWKGSYPDAVAALLASQYQQMEILRVEEQDDSDRVLLQSSATPMPIAVVKVEGVWRVDASSIIEFRKLAEQERRRQPSAASNQ